MRRQVKFLLLILVCAFPMHLKAQVSGSITDDTDKVSWKGHEKGTFIISPFYEFTHFKGFELQSIPIPIGYRKEISPKSLRRNLLIPIIRGLTQNINRAQPE